MNSLRPTWPQQLITVLLTATMTAALLLSLSGFWRQTFAPTSVILAATGAAVLGWTGWRRPGLLAALLGLTAVVALSLPLLDTYLTRRWQRPELHPLATEVLAFLMALRTWFDQLWAGQFETMTPEVAGFFLALVGLAAALMITREALQRGDTFWSLVAGGGLFGFQWALFWDYAQPYLVAYVAAGVVLWSVVHTAHRLLRWNREGRRIVYLPHWGFTGLSGLLVVLTAGLLPTYSAADLGAMADQIRTAFPALQRLRGAPESGGGRLQLFGLRQVGFGGDTTALGGPVVPNDRVALEVKLSQPISGPLYLRGTVHTQYTGFGWLPPEGPLAPVPPDQPLPTWYAASIPKEYVQLTVTPATLRSLALFSPLEPVLVADAPNPQFDIESNLVAGRIPDRGESYGVLARMGRTSRLQVHQLAHPTTYPPETPAGTVPEYLRPYLQLPGTPAIAEVRRLAENVVAGKEHPFDQAVAIERYLRTEYPYRLDVPRPPLVPPPDWDFAAYFLFDVRSGYCTYYSTAMAVMLRSLGIPARWVQGFALDPGGGTEVAVRNSQAHAWVEAYFPGYGWVLFDPTPRGDIPLPDRSYVPPPQSDQPALDDPLLDPTLRRLGVDNLSPLGPESGEAGTISFRLPADQLSTLAPAVARVLAALLALLAVLGALRLRTGIRWREPELAVQHSYQYLTRVLGQFGYGPRPDQTPREYLGAVGQVLPELAAPLGALVEMYEQARYGPGGSRLPAGAPALARRTLQAAQQSLRNRFGWGYYLWRRLTSLRRGSYMLPAYRR